MAEESRSLNTFEAASFLNAHVETVRRLARKGRIPAFKIGKDWRFRKEELFKWAQNNPQLQTSSTILVIDDDRTSRLVIRRLLEKESFSVTEAANGAEGLKCMQEKTVTLVLLDLEMPEMNGVEFLFSLNQSGSEIPVILVTGLNDGKLIENAMRYSPLLLIKKPVDSKKLLRTVKAVNPPNCGP